MHESRRLRGSRSSAKANVLSPAAQGVEYSAARIDNRIPDACSSPHDASLAPVGLDVKFFREETLLPSYARVVMRWAEMGRQPLAGSIVGLATVYAPMLQLTGAPQDS